MEDSKIQYYKEHWTDMEKYGIIHILLPIYFQWLSYQIHLESHLTPPRNKLYLFGVQTEHMLNSFVVQMDYTIMTLDPKIYATTLLQTVDDNKKGFTPNDVKKADLAKRVYEMVGQSSPRDFYNMIKFNMIQNCPVTIADVKAAKRIYGPDVYAIRGKTVRAYLRLA